MAATVIPAMGHDEAFGLVAETAYPNTGSPTAVDVFFRPVSNRMASAPRVSPLGGPSGVMVPYKYNSSLPRHFADVPDRSGPVTIECDYDDIGHILAAAIFSGVTADGANAATHTFTIPATTPTYMMDCCTLGRNNGVQDFRWDGGMIKELVLRGQPGQYVTATMDWIASGGSDGGAYTFPAVTLSTHPWVEFFHSDIGVDAGVATAPTGSDFMSGTGADVEEWTLTIRNNLTEDQAAGGGTLGLRAPVFANFREITLEWTHRWNSTKDFTDHHLPSTEAGRYKWVQLYLDQGTDAGDGTNTSIKFDIPYAIFLGDFPVYEGGGGALRQTIRVQASGGPSENPFTATLVNDVQGAPLVYGANAPS